MALLAVWAAVWNASAVPAAAEPPSETALERSGQTFSDRAADQGIPGAVMAVVADGRVVFTQAVVAGREIGAKTPFVIGSSGKSITALAVMQLVERGSLKLSDPVKRWVPELDLADDAAERRITVEQLLRHTSGIPPLAGGPLLRSVGQGTMLEAVAEIEGEELVSPPGSEFHYANANYVLAGLVIERASGESYGRYVERHVFEPLGAECSYATPAGASGVATGHRYWFGFTFAHGPTFANALQPAGYLISCAEDAGRYLAALLSGGRTATGERLASEESIDKLFAGGPEATLGGWADSQASRYGLGWFVGGPWRERAILHPGNTPDSSSMFVLLPDRGWGVVTMLAAGHELELPGNPEAMDLTSRNAVDALLGEPVKQGSLMRFYFVFDVLAFVLLALSAWVFGRAVRARRSGLRRGGRGAAAITAALLLAGLLMLLLPAIGLGYGAFWLWMPDLTLVVVLVGLLLTAAAAVRVSQGRDRRKA